MEKKVKHAYDFKLRCVEEVLKGRSAISVAAEFKCDRSQLWTWVCSYKRFGASCHIPRSNPSYDINFKMKVLKAVEKKSLTLNESCIMFNVSGSALILALRRNFSKEGIAGLERKLKGRLNFREFKQKKDIYKTFND
jgi:transposase